MIDMNMSIEGIMQECDYIAEVKGEAEADYGRIKNDERSSHNHIIGKDVVYYTNRSVKSGKTADGRDNYTPMRTSDDYRNRYTDAALRRNRNRKADKIYNKMRNDNKKTSTNESASIFDSLFDQI
jgi:hypothetical protein